MGDDALNLDDLPEHVATAMEESHLGDDPRMVALRNGGKAFDEDVVDDAERPGAGFRIMDWSDSLMRVEAAYGDTTSEQRAFVREWKLRLLSSANDPAFWANIRIVADEYLRDFERTFTVDGDRWPYGSIDARACHLQTVRFCTRAIHAQSTGAPAPIHRGDRLDLQCHSLLEDGSYGIETRENRRALPAMMNDGEDVK